MVDEQNYRRKKRENCRRKRGGIGKKRGEIGRKRNYGMEKRKEEIQKKRGNTKNRKEEIQLASWENVEGDKVGVKLLKGEDQRQVITTSNGNSEAPKL